jgi:hypothetical protein
LPASILGRTHSILEDDRHRASAETPEPNLHEIDPVSKKSSPMTVTMVDFIRGAIDGITAKTLNFSKTINGRFPRL